MTSNRVTPSSEAKEARSTPADTLWIRRRGDDNRGATRCDEFSKVEPESGLSSPKSRARSHSREGDVLAREAARPDLRLGVVIGIYLLDVRDLRYVWPVLLQDVETEPFDLALSDGFQSSASEFEIEASDAREERRDSERGFGCGFR